MPYKPVDHVQFDMDGLLIDSEHQFGMAFNEVAKRYGKEITWETEVKMLASGELTCAKIIVSDLNLPISPSQFLDEAEKEFPRFFSKSELMSGVEKLINHLNKHKIPISIASASGSNTFDMKTSRLFGGHFRSQFHHILLAEDEDEVKASKPAPDTYLVGLKRFDEPDLTSDRCLVFEDSIRGVLAAIRAGMQVVHVPDPRLDVAHFMDADPELRPTLILKSIEDFVPEQFGLPPYDN